MAKKAAKGSKRKALGKPGKGRKAAAAPKRGGSRPKPAIKEVATVSRPKGYDQIADHVICGNCNQPKSEHTKKFGRCPSYAIKRPSTFRAKEVDTELGTANELAPGKHVENPSSTPIDGRRALDDADPGEPDLGGVMGEMEDRSVDSATDYSDDYSGGDD